MTKQFSTPRAFSKRDKFELDVEFQNVSVQGSDKTTCQVVVSSRGSHSVSLILKYPSWFNVKTDFSSLESLLFFVANENIFFSDKNSGVVYVLSSLTGCKGLYPMPKSAVVYDRSKT